MSYRRGCVLGYKYLQFNTEPIAWYSIHRRIYYIGRRKWIVVNGAKCLDGSQMTAIMIVMRWAYKLYVSSVGSPRAIKWVCCAFVIPGLENSWLSTTHGDPDQITESI